MNDRVSIIQLDGGIADVRLTRPDKMNALDGAMFAGIAEAIATLERMAGLRCVILSGEGKAFCAGLDMASMAAGGSGIDLMTRSHGDATLPQHVAWGWRMLPVPVIAAVHGVAFGGGFQIMSGADIRIIHPDTRCAIMEMKWGLVPDMAGFPLWRTQVADDCLRELVYTNAEFTGAEAHRMGFVSHLADDPYAAAMVLARAIAGKNPHAIRGAKRLCNALGHASDADVLLAESAEQLAVIRTANQIEAVMANMQGRAPNFED
ncbi:MAG: crotonase/enoyl-CoA hydratase family protein [Sphingopyxis sp.]